MENNNNRNRTTNSSGRAQTGAPARNQGNTRKPDSISGNKAGADRKGNPDANNHKKGHKGKKKHSRMGKKVRWILLLTSFIFSLTALAVILIFYLKYGDDFSSYQKQAEKLVGESTIDTFKQTQSSLVYDSNKKLITVLKGEKDVYYLKSEDIPDYAKQAMIAIEDKKFLKHAGIDLSANVRAFIALVKHKGNVTQGASTITQQLARNIFLTNEVSLERKLKEIFLSVELERKYTKDQIMEFYLNNIYFSNGFYGIQAASKGYFNKDVKKLSLSQIAYLCAIPNNPTLYDPFDHPENTVKRRDRILYQMYKDGWIGKDDYDTACEEEIKLVPRKMHKNNYVETFVFYSAARALMKEQGFEFKNQFKDDVEKKEYDKAYSEAYSQCLKSLYYKGYRIYTSIDLKKEAKLQKAVNDVLKDYKDKGKNGIYSLQSAAVSIDNETGRVVAIVGGRYQKSTGYTLNRAYQSYRQPGSSIKPLIVYTPSFEHGHYPDDIVNDKKFEGGPSNSSGTYLGKIPIRKAVEKSINTIAWQLYEELTPKVGLSYLLKMNFNRIDKNDYFPATSLGGFTYGVSPLEMTSAYAALENDGVYREPTCIIKILDSNGDTVVNDNIPEKRIYDKNAARIMTDVMTGVIKNGTGRGLGLDNMISAGKTGTTNDKKDGWFMGYTPYYTTGVWVGCDTPKSMNELSGATFPGNIWRQYMNEIHHDLAYKDFPSYIDDRPKKETKEEEETKETIMDDTKENTTTEDQTDSGSKKNTKDQEDTTGIEYPDPPEDIEDTSSDDWYENSGDFNDTDSDFEDSGDGGQVSPGDGDDSSVESWSDNGNW